MSTLSRIIAEREEAAVKAEQAAKKKKKAAAKKPLPPNHDYISKTNFICLY